MGIWRDLIAVVESCYDLTATENGWLQGVADSVHAVVQPEEGLLAYHVDVDAQGFRIHTPVQSGDPPMNMVERIETMATLLEEKRHAKLGLLARGKAKVYERVVRTALAEPADRIVQSEYRRVGPNWMYTLGAPVDDVFVLMNHHVDGNGATAIFGGLKKKRAFRPSERTMSRCSAPTSRLACACAAACAGRSGPWRRPRTAPC